MQSPAVTSGNLPLCEAGALWPLITNSKFNPSVCLSVCLPETPLPWATCALHQHTVPFRNQDEPRD